MGCATKRYSGNFDALFYLCLGCNAQLDTLAGKIDPD